MKLRHFITFLIAAGLMLPLHGQTASKVTETEKSVATNPKIEEIEEIEKVLDGDSAGGVHINVSPEVSEKLSSQELAEIIKFTVKQQNKTPHSESYVEVLVPFFVFTALVIIVFIAYYLPLLRARDVQETVRVMLREKQDIPESYFEAMTKKPIPTSESDKRKGFLLVALGLSASCLIWLANPESSNDGSWSVGIIPLFLGIAFLALSYMKKDDSLEK